MSANQENYPCHYAVVDRAEAAIDLAAALESVKHDDFGGYDVFIGRVRQNNLGRQVLGISYDIFDALALNLFAELIAKVRETEPRMGVYLAHAKGRLDVGEVAVVVAVGTPHRDEAFRACRELIEQVKHQSPIWKQEHYVDGDSAWSEGCSLCEQQLVAEAARRAQHQQQGAHQHEHEHQHDACVSGAHA